MVFAREESSEPMKITDVEAIVLRLPEVDAARCDGTQDTLIIRIATDEGIQGVGEVDSAPLVCKAVIDSPSSHAIATGIRGLVIGEDPLQIRRLWESMYQGTIYFGRSGPALHAISGVDQALWDIYGKAVGMPVAQLLGGVHTRNLRAYASALMPETPVEAGALAERYARMGYRAMKFGWGPIGRDPRLDEDLVRSIRSAVGQDIEVMIDAGQAWDLKGALRMAAVYERYGVVWLEEPLHPDDVSGYRSLSRSTTIPIAAGEQESGRFAFQRLIEEAEVDILQPDLGRCGGFTEGMNIAHNAHIQRKRVVPHAFKSGILLAASAHFAAAIPNGGMIEHTVSTSPIARDLVMDPLHFEDGYVSVPLDRPGLGIEIDERVIHRYRFA